EPRIARIGRMRSESHHARRSSRLPVKTVGRFCENAFADRRLTQTPYKSGCPCYPRYRGLKGTDADSAERVSLLFRHKRAIALVEIKRRADAGDLERLSPPAGWKIIRTFDCFHFRF